VSFRSVFPSSFFRLSLGQRVTSLRFVHQFLLVATVSVACFFLSGCATSSADIRTYLDPGFTSATIHRLAVIPIRNGISLLSKRDSLMRSSGSYIQRNPSIVIVGVRKQSRRSTGVGSRTKPPDFKITTIPVRFRMQAFSGKLANRSERMRYSKVKL
jgi:hypothetical protein